MTFRTASDFRQAGYVACMAFVVGSLSPIHIYGSILSSAFVVRWYVHLIEYMVYVILMLLAVYKVLACPALLAHRRRAIGWVLLATVPVWANIVVWCHLPSARPVDWDYKADLNRQSLMLEAVARWQHGRPIYGEKVIAYGSGVTPAHVAALDDHVRRIEAALGSTIPYRVVWIAGVPEGDVGYCTGWVAVCDPLDVQRQLDGSISRTDRHEIAHAVIFRMTGGSVYVPDIIAEGSAEVFSGDPPGLLEYKAWKRRLTSSISLGDVLQLRAPLGNTVAYAFGGGLMNYIQTKYGAHRFLLLNQLEFNQSFGAGFGNDGALKESDVWAHVDDCVWSQVSRTELALDVNSDLWHEIVEFHRAAAESYCEYMENADVVFDQLPDGPLKVLGRREKYQLWRLGQRRVLFSSFMSRRECVSASHMEPFAALWTVDDREVEAMKPISDNPIDQANANIEACIWERESLIMAPGILLARDLGSPLSCARIEELSSEVTSLGTAYRVVATRTSDKGTVQRVEYRINEVGLPIEATYQTAGKDDKQSTSFTYQNVDGREALASVEQELENGERRSIRVTSFESGTLTKEDFDLNKIAPNLTVAEQVRNMWSEPYEARIPPRNHQSLWWIGIGAVVHCVAAMWGLVLSPTRSNQAISTPDEILSRVV